MQTYPIKIKFKAVNYVNKPKNACYKLSVDEIFTTHQLVDLSTCQLIIIYSACKGNT